MRQRVLELCQGLTTPAQKIDAIVDRLPRTGNVLDAALLVALETGRLVLDRHLEEVEDVDLVVDRKCLLRFD